MVANASAAPSGVVRSIPALADLTRSNSDLRAFLHGLPGVDQVGADARAAELATRSIKTDSKRRAIDLAISMIDLTTLEGQDTPGKVRALCAKAGIGDLVRLREEDSQLALPAMVASGETFDFAFIDGSHHFDYAFTDVMYALRLVKPGGLVLVDDTWMPAVRNVVDFFVRNLGIEIDPESSHGAHDWRLRRTRFRRKEKGGRASMLGLRVPQTPDDRVWDHFAPFGDFA